MNTKEHIADFEKVARPLIEWLNEHYNPHATIIITPDSAEVVSGEIAFHTKDYIKD